MERKRFLELCQHNSVVESKKMVVFRGYEYIPKSLMVWFNEKGETLNTAVLISKNERSIMNVDLKEIEECEDGRKKLL